MQTGEALLALPSPKKASHFGPTKQCLGHRTAGQTREAGRHTCGIRHPPALLMADSTLRNNMPRPGPQIPPGQSKPMP